MMSSTTSIWCAGWDPGGVGIARCVMDGAMVCLLKHTRFQKRNHAPLWEGLSIED